MSRRRTPFRAAGAVIALAVLTGCGNSAPSASAPAAPTAEATSASIADRASAQRLLDDAIQVALRAGTGEFGSIWTRTTESGTSVEYLFGEFDVRQGRWQAHVSTDPEIKYGGRPTTAEVRYGSGRLYTSDTSGWPKPAADRHWQANKVVLPDGLDERLPPLLAAIQAAEAVAVRDRGTISPGHIITGTVPAPVAVALLQLGAALQQAGIDPLTVGGRATFELRLDTDLRPRQFRLTGTGLGLERVTAALPQSVEALAAGTTFDGSFSDYGTDVSIPLPKTRT